ncbi:UNVERIFIED_CONTAM: hypothetical protein Sradi_2364400 [Sesamum radiatum]|uniref:Uncharacterized protein n=1 Tax=Sesamum radiatum TaxID=300843 RepID=A0AAW2T915_SESRA
MFRQCLMDCDMQDLGCVGDMFTWCNHREAPSTVTEHLDRACRGRQWLDRFPGASVLHLPMACSDHAAILLRSEMTDKERVQRAKPRFQLEAAWLQSEECAAVRGRVEGFGYRGIGG